MMARAGWRLIVATWGGAAFLLLRQFGVPAPSSGPVRETRITQVVEAGERLAAAERIQDARILTVPLEPCQDDLRQDGIGSAGARFSVN